MTVEHRGLWISLGVVLGSSTEHPQTYPLLLVVYHLDRTMIAPSAQPTQNDYLVIFFTLGQWQGLDAQSGQKDAGIGYVGPVL